MKKILGIVVSVYPFGMMESFFHDELQVLSKNFSRIYIIIPEADKVDRTEMKYQLPENVQILFIQNSFGISDKILSLFRVNPFAVFSRTKSSLQLCDLRINWQLFKISWVYDAKEYGFRRKLMIALQKRGIELNQLALYTYWFTEYTYAISKLKKRYPHMVAFTRAHGWDLYFERHTPSYLPYRGIIIPQLDITFVISQNGKDYLINKLHMNENDIEVQRLGTYCDGINSTLPNRSTIRLLSNSYVTPVKNIESIIDALSIIDHLEVEWLHIGGGDEYFDYIKKIAHNKLSNRHNIKFNFTGTINQAEVHHILMTQEIDLFLNTSISEGIPVSIMEALSYGIPAIAPKIGGVSEIIIDNHNGFLLSTQPTAVDVMNMILRFYQLSDEVKKNFRTNARVHWENNFNASANYARLVRSLDRISQKNID